MNRDLNSLLPEAADKCRRLLSLARERGIDIIVTSTLRTKAHQRALYAQGRRPLDEVNTVRKFAGMPPIKESANRIVTRARVSAHETGRAFDVAVMRGASPTWDARADMNQNGTPEYEELGALGESIGLVWGGRFGMRDLCHFELGAGQAQKDKSVETPAAAPTAEAAGMRPARKRRRRRSGWKTRNQA